MKIWYTLFMSVEKIVKFDGDSIAIPPELRAAGPQEIKITFDPQPTNPKKTRNLLDIVGKAPRFRSDEELDQALRREREAW
jgi:hypothetical protein